MNVEWIENILNNKQNTPDLIDEKIYLFLKENIISDDISDIKYIIEKYNIRIEYGAESLLNITIETRKLEIFKYITENCKINDYEIQKMIHHIIQLYIIYFDELYFDMFKIIINIFNFSKKAFNYIISYNILYDKINIIKYLIGIGCDVNAIPNIEIKHEVLTLLRKDKINQLLNII